jgi:hypothetical protein
VSVTDVTIFFCINERGSNVNSLINAVILGREELCQFSHFI